MKKTEQRVSEKINYKLLFLINSNDEIFCVIVTLIKY